MTSVRTVAETAEMPPQGGGRAQCQAVKHDMPSAEGRRVLDHLIDRQSHRRVIRGNDRAGPGECEANKTRLARENKVHSQKTKTEASNKTKQKKESGKKKLRN